MKKCPKCGRTSPPALVVCPRCKTPLEAAVPGRPPDNEKLEGSVSEKKTGGPSATRSAVTGAVLAVLLLVFAGVLFMNWERLIAVYSRFSDMAPSTPARIVRPSNFHELLGTWSGREINRSAGWTFSFSDGYNVYVSGPEGWYRGKAAIHWELGGNGDGIRVPPGAGVLDVDIQESSAGAYAGKTSVGAFSVHYGTTLKLCSGEPGKTERPESFEPIAGIRCFELARTAEAPLPSPAGGVAGPSATAPEATSVEDDEVRAARDAFKRCAEAVRSGNISLARDYISRATLQEMEQSGQFDMAMGMVTGMNLDEFRASRQGDTITFKQLQKQGDATMSMSMKMVKEDGHWKLGR